MSNLQTNRTFDFFFGLPATFVTTYLFGYLYYKKSTLFYRMSFTVDVFTVNE